MVIFRVGARVVRVGQRLLPLTLVLASADECCRTRRSGTCTLARVTGGNVVFTTAGTFELR